MAFGANVLHALVQEKAPYLITIFFASTAWFITYSVGQITDSPTLEYATRASQIHPDQYRFVVDIRNISRKQRFQNLGFRIRLDPADHKDHLVYWDNRADAPASSTPVLPFVSGTPAQAVDFTVQDLQPGWVIHLVADHSGPRLPAFRLASADAPVRLAERSLETFLVRNEISTMLAVILIYGVVIVLIVGRYSASASDSSERPVFD
jgi:hypothetical protein